MSAPPSVAFDRARRDDAAVVVEEARERVAEERS
jgi:hypothetical protein